MSRSGWVNRSPRSGWRLLVAVGLTLLLPACESSPEPPARPAANPGRGIEAGRLSLTLAATPNTFEPAAKARTTLTITFWNALPQARRVEEVTAAYGLPGLAKGKDVRYIEDLTWVVRFADGTAFAVLNGYPYPYPDDETAPGCLPRAPLELPGGGRLAGQVDLNDHVFRERDLGLAFTRCRTFCLVAVVEKLGLRSNAVFLNGEFALPANFDPVAEAKAYRKKAEPGD